MQSQERVPGRRPIRHYVRVTPAQEALLQERARAANVTVAKLLVDSALGDGLTQRQIILELAGIRRLLADDKGALHWLTVNYGRHRK